MTTGKASQPLVSLLVLAFGSGSAALIYEIVWFQYLELFLGSTSMSLGVLLVTFMGGTCLGSLLFPLLVPARLRALRVYAAIELGIALLGLVMLRLMPVIGEIYTERTGYGQAGLLLRGLASAVCLLLPTMLMGATLPALARCVNPSQRGVSWLGLIYGANLSGAVAGSLLAGFYLLRVFDITTATYAAATINVAVCVHAWILRVSPQELSEDGAPLDVIEATDGETASIYLVIALSGFCALAAEVVWTRTLALLLGGSVYTFSLILAVFLAGLGIGSGIGSLMARTSLNARSALAACQLLAAAAIAWTAYSLGASMPYWPVDPSRSTSLWFTFQLDLDRALWALVPATILWGASFPFALRAAAGTTEDSSTLLSRMYVANTIGAIAGTAAILLVLGSAGTQRAEQLLIAISTIGGLFLLLAQNRFSGNILMIAAGGLAGLLVYTVPPISSLLVAHGRYASSWIGKSDILHVAEGFNSSVAVSSFPDGVRTFHVAGKIQASNVPRDMRLQRMLGHLTTLTALDPSSVLVIGCGAGITAGAVSIDPRVKSVTIAEIEGVVPEVASEYFQRENFSVIQNPKTHLVIDDGRHFLRTTKNRFDAITADPLDPWVKGAAGLYTKEFFETVRDRLNPGGVVTVYIQLFETNIDAVKSAVATFFEVFPNGTIWGNPVEGRGHDMLLLGQAETLHIDLDKIDQRLKTSEFSPVAASLHDVGMDSAADLFSTYAGRKEDLAEWLQGAEVNRDKNLRMQYLAGRGLDRDDSAAIYAELLRFRRFPEDLFSGSQGRVQQLKKRF